MPSVLVLNGPNLNLLGTRKPEVYGHTTLADVEEMCREAAGKLGLEVEFRQSNHEGQLIDWIHECGARRSRRASSIGAVYNPGAHTHTSVAIRDAIEGARLPVIERTSRTCTPARSSGTTRSSRRWPAGIVVGFGVQGYLLALQGLHRLCRSRRRRRVSRSCSC